MALHVCRECGRQISELANTCPGCGAPVFTELKTYVDKYSRSRAMAVTLLGLGVLLLLSPAMFEGDELVRKFAAYGGWMVAGGIGLYLVVEFFRNLALRELNKARKAAGQAPLPNK